MSETALSEIITFGQRLDTSQVGEDYLNSPQRAFLNRHAVNVLRPLALPVIAAARFMVYLEDGSPTTVGVPRIGKDGKTFEELKIRTMKVGSEFCPVPVWPKPRHDPRVTGVGSVLREWSLDELMQLQNVARGEMSIVGDRPKSPLEFEEYTLIDPSFPDAYTIAAPGMTGLEQTMGRANLTPDERIDLTHEYRHTACLKLDLDILLKTAGAVISREGAF